MRVYRYQGDGSGPRVAVAGPGGRPVDLATAWEAVVGDPLDPGIGSSTARLIEAGPEIWAQAEVVANAAESGWAPGGVRWLCPLDRLASLRDFLAFEDHVKLAAERRRSSIPAYWYDAPVYYKGNHRQVIGPDDICPWPPYAKRLDFELELAMIVGRGGRDLSPEEAASHVFGFTIFNDFSARDVQVRETTAWLGPAKAKDFCNAFGPCIVTASEVGTQPDLMMSCRVNGEGSARSGRAHWGWSEMLAHVSQAEDVYPLDVYGSGTPGGCCGLDLGRELSPGDVVELEVEGIGVLRNRIGSRPR